MQILNVDDCAVEAPDHDEAVIVIEHQSCEKSEVALAASIFKCLTTKASFGKRAKTERFLLRHCERLPSQCPLWHHHSAQRVKTMMPIEGT